MCVAAAVKQIVEAMFQSPDITCCMRVGVCGVQASGWVAASRLICCWTPEETRGASLGSLAFAARVSQLAATIVGQLMLTTHCGRNSLLKHLVAGAIRTCCCCCLSGWVLVIWQALSGYTELLYKSDMPHFDHNSSPEVQSCS